MRTNGVNRSEPLLSMFSEQTIDEETRNDLMAELFQLDSFCLSACFSLALAIRSSATQNMVAC